MGYIPPYAPSIPDWMRQVATELNKRQDIATVTDAPAKGNWNSIGTAFDGDLGNAYRTFGRTLTGSATLGLPTSGYVHNPELATLNGYFLNKSGHNQSTSSNGGRTSWAALGYFKLDQQGQGDMPGITFSGALYPSGPVGVTSWLAMSAISFVNGTITMLGHGGYANFFETDAQLGSYDGAAVGYTSRITRGTGDTANGLGAVTLGFFAKSEGLYPVDAAYSAAGLFKCGLDLSASTFSTNKAGIALPPDVRFYGNASSSNGSWATSLGNSYFTYSSSISGWNFIVGGTSRFQVTGTQVTITTVRLAADGKVALTGLSNFASDSAAATGGVAVGELYRNGSIVQVRVS